MIDDTDVIVLDSFAGSGTTAHAVLALRDRYRTAAVVAPPMHRVPGARPARSGDIVQVGTVAVEVVSDAHGLDVEITRAGGAGGRSGPGAGRSWASRR